MQKKEVVVYSDEKETKSGVPGLLIELGARVEILPLNIGDYILSERVVIERKTIYDFANSVKNKRFFRQLQQLKEEYEKPLLLIEGNLKNIKGIYPEGSKGALSFVFLSFDIPILCTQNKEDTAEIIWTIAKQEQLIKPPVSFFPKRKVYSKEDEVLRVLESLPDIGPVTAKNMQNYISSLKELVLKEEKELYKIPGIGKKRAKKIYEFFRTSINKKNE